MTRWFRHYAGMMRDEKLVRAAMKAKQPVERVVWVWGALLESAAELNDGGRYDFDTEEAAYFLRCDASDMSSILNALCDLGRIEADRVTKWGDRQYESDSSKERQQRHRDRKRASRDGGVTAQEAETEPETDIQNAPPDTGAAGAGASFEDFWEAFPQNPSSSEARARETWDKTKPVERPAIVAAAVRYAKWFGQDCEARGRTLDAGLRYVPHGHKWLEGAWKEAASLVIKGESSGPVIPMVRLHRDRDHDLWERCEQVQGKKAATDGMEWSFRQEVVDQARALAGAVN